MGCWPRGEADVEALLAAGELQQLSGTAADCARLMARPALTLETSQSAIERDPNSAFVRAYDAARQARADGAACPPRAAPDDERWPLRR